MIILTNRVRKNKKKLQLPHAILYMSSKSWKEYDWKIDDRAVWGKEVDRRI